MISDLKRRVKYLLSFLKTDWELADYPVRRVRHDVALFEGTPFAAMSWSAQIDEWPAMRGHGKTPEEAYANLAAAFAARKRTGEPLPRPGTKMTIKIAPADRLERYEDISRDFMERILELTPGTYILTDMSSLWDFEFEVSLEECYTRITAAYGTDVSDIESANLVDIFERIYLAGKLPDDL